MCWRYEKPVTTVVHCKKARYDVYIGRGRSGSHMTSKYMKPWKKGWLGNPYKVTEDVDREGAIELFREAFLKKIQEDDAFRKAVLVLRGKALGCWCRPRSCHGDVIAEWLDEEERRTR